MVTDASVNCYEVLGVPRDASSEDVRAAFRLRSHMFHPDKYENYAEPLRSQLVAEAAKEFKKLTGAYEVLRDPVRRAAHDRDLVRVGRGAPAPAPSTYRRPTASTAAAETATPTPTRRPRRTAAQTAAAEAPRERDPQILVRPERLDFGNLSPGGRGQLALKIQNIGGRTLFGEVSTDKAFLTLSDRTFISNQIVIFVSLDTTGMVAGQAYAARITVRTLNGGNEVVPVTFRIDGDPAPQLTGVPSLVDFGETERGKRKVRTITLANAGTGTIIGSAQTRLTWLSISEPNFRGNAVSLDLVIDTSALEPGEHEGSVLFSTTGGNAKLSAMVTVVAPVTGEALVKRGAVDASPTPPPSAPAPDAAPATLPRDVQRALLARIQKLVPETDWEEEFLAAIAQLVRAGRTLAPGELAKIFEIEARAAGQ